MRRIYILAVALVMANCFSTNRSAQADWPTFLGGSGADVPPASKLPLNWEAEESLAWATDLPGHGQSSPIVIGDQVYVTAIEGPNKELNLVLSYDLATGELKWRHEMPNSLQVKNDVYTSRAAPSPVADENGVVAFFESGDMVGMSPAGEVLWQRSLMEDYGKYAGRFGLGGSLAQLGDRVFVLADNEGPSYLLAIDKKTGETLWKSDRDSRTAWSSPSILMVEGEPQVVVSSAGTVDGYSAEDGSLLWSIDDVGGNTVATPTDIGAGRFLVGASPGRNGENSDGASRSNMCVQITKLADGGFEPKVLWRNEKATSSFGSPIAYQDRAYYVNRAGVVFCIDVASGELLFNARIAESNWATPIGIGERVYFFGKDGETTVLEASDEHNELARNKLLVQAAAAGGPGGFNAEIQYGVAPTEYGFLIRTGTRLLMVSGK